MGTVYECVSEVGTKEELALKLLRTTITQNERLAARFRNELHASYRISHSNVVRGKEFFHSDQYLGFTMELVKGGNLADLLKARKRFGVSETIQILRQLCAGLEAIHAAGIVHRDLKPQNLLVDKRGKVKITDFSAAKFRNPPPGYQDNEIIGTICYMSPEALAGAALDARADIYSVGVLAYELLSGFTPFDGLKNAEDPAVRKSMIPVPVHRVVPTVPVALSEILVRAMHPKIERRFKSIVEVSEALRRLDSMHVPPPRKPRVTLAHLRSVHAAINYQRCAMVCAAILFFSLPVLATSTPLFRGTFMDPAVRAVPDSIEISAGPVTVIRVDRFRERAQARRLREMKVKETDEVKAQLIGLNE